MQRILDAIVFAMWLPELGDKLMAFRGWFQLLIDAHFQDCDIFIGLNPSAYTSEAVAVFEQYRNVFPHMEYAIVGADQVVQSDVSGYQKALELMQKSKKRYRLVWFLHTKGMSHAAKLSLRFIHQFGLPFVQNRDRVSKQLLSNPKIGSWSPYMTISPVLSAPPFLNYIHDWSRWWSGFEYPMLSMFHVYTFVVMKGEPLQRFLDGAVSQGGETIWTECWARRYPSNHKPRHFCEWFLGEIVFRQGYIPSWDHLMSLPSKNSPSPCPVTPSQVEMLIRAQQDKVHPSSLFRSDRGPIQYPLLKP